MVIRYRYTEWDGTQEIPPLDPDDILNALTDDLMNFGDLQHALRNLLQRGMRNPAGDRTQGLRDLLQQLRQQRRQTLDRYNLSSAFDDIQKRLEEILERERGTLEERLGGQQPDADDRDESEHEGTGGEGGQRGEKGAREEQGGEMPNRQGSRGMQGQRGEGGQQGQSGQSGQQGAEGRNAEQGGGQQSDGAAGEQAAANDRQFADMLKNIIERKQNFLEALPKDLGGQMKELQNYEFIDPQAASDFQELMEMLKQAMMETFFKNLQNQLAGMSPEDMARMKDMIRDLNQ